MKLELALPMPVLEPRFCRQEGGQRKFRRFRKYLKSFFASLFDTVTPHQYLTIRPFLIRTASAPQGLGR